MLKNLITINCSSCSERTCLRFSQKELETPDFIKDFPAASYDNVCLAGAISFEKGNIFIDKERCINCGLCAYRCHQKKIKMNEKEKELNEKVTKIMMTIPNIIDPSVPIGKNDEENF